MDTVIYLGEEYQSLGQLFTCQELNEMNFLQTKNTNDLLQYLTGELEALMVLVDLDFMIHQNYSHAASLFAAGNCSPMKVLLGKFSTKALELAIQAGFDEFVSKPLDKEVLLALLKKAGRETRNMRKLPFDENNHALKQEHL